MLTSLGELGFRTEGSFKRNARLGRHLASIVPCLFVCFGLHARLCICLFGPACKREANKNVEF